MGAFTDVMNDWDLAVGQRLDHRLAHAHLPNLLKLLNGPGGADLAAEIAQLVGSTREPQRASRRNVELMGQLETEGYHRNVVIRDISETGTRLRVARTGTLDIVQCADMRLCCRLEGENGPEHLNVGLHLVRVVDTAPRHLELAYQFRHVSAHQESVLQRMSAIYAMH